MLQFNRKGALSGLVEAASGSIAHALAASGRGVAVVSEDLRLDLRLVAIDVGGGELLRIRLLTVWEARGEAAQGIERVAGRLAGCVAQRYPDVAAAP